MNRSILLLVLVIGATLPATGCNKTTVPRPAANASNQTPADANTARLNKEIADYTKAIQLNPQDANARGELAYYKRGQDFAEQGQHEKAIADFTEAIRLYPVVKSPFLSARLMECYALRGSSHKKLGDYDEAITDYTEVIQGGSGSFSGLGEASAFGGFVAEAYYNRGLCYDEKKEHDKALLDYKEAVNLEPTLMNDDLRKRMSQ